MKADRLPWGPGPRQEPNHLRHQRVRKSDCLFRPLISLVTREVSCDITCLLGYRFGGSDIQPEGCGQDLG